MPRFITRKSVLIFVFLLGWSTSNALFRANKFARVLKQLKKQEYVKAENTLNGLSKDYPSSSLVSYGFALLYSNDGFSKKDNVKAHNYMVDANHHLQLLLLLVGLDILAKYFL